MPMGVPSAGAQINFNITRARGILANLEDCAAEIGPVFQIVETGVKNSDTLAVQGYELFAAQALVLPNSLEQALRRRVVVIAENRDGSAANAPFGVKIVGKRRHREQLMRERVLKVKCGLKVAFDKITSRISYTVVGSSF